MTNRRFLFEYRFEGATYGVELCARDAAEARRRLSALGLARYRGEIHATIRVPGGGLLLRLWNWLTEKRR